MTSEACILVLSDLIACDDSDVNQRQAPPSLCKWQPSKDRTQTTAPVGTVLDKPLAHRLVDLRLMAIGPGEGPAVVTMNQTQKSWIFQVICWPLRFTGSWPRLVSGSSSKKQLYHLFMATGSQGPQPWIKSEGRWQTSPSNRFPYACALSHCVYHRRSSFTTWSRHCAGACLRKDFSDVKYDFDCGSFTSFRPGTRSA